MQRQTPGSYSLAASVTFFVVALLYLQFFGSREMLAFTRTGIIEGELWRLFSGHIIHVSWQHLALNLAGLVFCQFLFRMPLRHLLGLAFSAALVISAGLLLLTSYHYYLGLSGILHAWLVAGAIFTLSDSQDKRMRVISWLVLLLLLCKIGFEQLHVPKLVVESITEQFIGSPIVSEAHWLGLVAGVVYALLLTIARISPILGRAGTR